MNDPTFESSRILGETAYKIFITEDNGNAKVTPKMTIVWILNILKMEALSVFAECEFDSFAAAREVLKIETTILPNNAKTAATNASWRAKAAN